MRSQLVLPATITISLPLPLKTPQENDKMKDKLKLLFHNNSPRLKEIPMVSARDIIQGVINTSASINVSTRIAKIVTVLKDIQSFDWKERVSRVQEIAEIVDLMSAKEQSNTPRNESVISARSSAQGQFQVNTIEDLIKTLKFPLQAQILDTRSQVLKEVCLVLSHLALALTKLQYGKIPLIERYMEQFMTRETLFKSLASGKTALQDLSHACLQTLFGTFSSQTKYSLTLSTKMISLISDQLLSKNTFIRQKVSGYFNHYLISEFPFDIGDKLLNKLHQIITLCCSDANDQVRKQGQNAQATFQSRFPNFQIKLAPKPTSVVRKPNFQKQSPHLKYHSAQPLSARSVSASINKDKNQVVSLQSQKQSSPISHRLYNTISQNLSVQPSKTKSVVKKQLNRSKHVTPLSGISNSSNCVTPKTNSISVNRSALEQIRESSTKYIKKKQLASINVSPLNYALKSLKSRKSNHQLNLSQQSQSYQSVQVNISHTRHKSILSPKASPTRHSSIILRDTPSSSHKLQEKSLKVFESLRMQQRQPENFEQSSASRSPINININLDLEKKLNEDNVLRIVNQEDASNSSHISHQSSPISFVTTPTNKTLYQYITSISPSPSRLKLKTQASQGGSSSNVASWKQTPNMSGVNSPRQSLEQALKDALSHMPTKRITALMFIQRALNQQQVPANMFKNVFRILIDAIGDSQNQIGRLSMDVIKGIIEIQPRIFEKYLTKLLQKLLEIMSNPKAQDNKEMAQLRESLIHDLIRKYSSQVIVTDLLSITDIDKFIPNQTYMINTFEIISTIIQQIQQFEDQSLQFQQSSQQPTCQSLYDTLVLDTHLLPFLVSSLILSRPFDSDPAPHSETKLTLYRLSKTILELLYCVSSQSAFTHAFELHLSSTQVSTLIQVIELQSHTAEEERETEEIDMDPELYSLLQSISMENEPQPALTYHSTQKQTNNNNAGGLSSAAPVVEDTLMVIDGMSGIQSSEREVRIKAVKRLAQVRNKMGDKAFQEACKGKLTSAQISLVNTASIMLR